MNLNGDEKRIQQLFREMRSDDQRRAPRFAGVLEAAISGMVRTQGRAWSMKLALVVATLALVALTAVVVIRQSTIDTAGNSDRQAVIDQEPPAPNPDLIKPHLVTSGVPRHQVVKHVRHRLIPSEPAIDMKSLFAWQSPTASLLKAPGEDLLITLPRVGESLRTIKMFSPDIWN